MVMCRILGEVMKKSIFIVITILMMAGTVWGQGQNFPGGGSSSSSSGSPSTVTQALGKSIIIGEYPLTAGSGTTIADISGNGNNATMGSCGSGNPTWGAAPAYGLSVVSASSQCVNMPATLNSALYYYLYVKFDTASQNSTGYNSPWLANVSANSCGLAIWTPNVAPGYNSNLINYKNGVGAAQAGIIFSGTGSIAASMQTADEIYVNGIATSTGTWASCAGNVTSGNYQ